MRKFLKFLLWVVGALSFVIIVLRLTVFDYWTIPDDQVLDASIRPSLSAGDLVVISTVGSRVFGDLVRCTDPEDAQRYVVGRIVGMPGDKIEVRNPDVIVNGKKYNAVDACKEDVAMVPHPTSGSPVKLGCGRVEMAGGWHFRLSGPSAESPTQHTVGEGRVYLLSDDRSFHDDSRDFGAIPIESCTGVILFRIWGKGGFSDESGRFSYIH